MHSLVVLKLGWINILNPTIRLGLANASLIKLDNRVGINANHVSRPVLVSTKESKMFLTLCVGLGLLVSSILQRLYLLSYPNEI